MQDQPPAASDLILDVRGLAKRYGQDGEPDCAQVLTDVSFRLGRGQSLAITGPSGSGKSTLLNILGALDEPDAGEVLLEGRPLAGSSEKALARIRNRRIGFVFQLHHLLPQCTLLENVLVPTLPLGLGKAQQQAVRDRAEALLERVGLSGRKNYVPGKLSGGERQRAAVVRALINQPTLLLADEPTGALDEHSALSLAELLGELKVQQNLAMVVVTHWAELAGRMDRVMALHEGRLLEKAK